MQNGSKSTTIINWLIGEMESGEITPGSPLPSRMHIMEKFGVARATADKAMAELVAQGRAFGRRGAGTFACEPSSSSRVFIVNPSQECIDHLCPLLNDKIAYEIISSDKLEASTERLLRPGSRIIWDRPGAQDKGMMALLEKSVSQQLVINRRAANLNYICTDSQSGISEGVALMQKAMQDAPWAILAPPLDSQKYYWAEREIFFYQEITKSGGQIVATQRIAEESWSHINTTIKNLLTQLPHPAIICTPEQEYVAPILAAASTMKLKPGRDFGILMTDHKPQFDALEGIVALEQNFNQMMREAAAWALHKDPPPLKKLIRHCIHKGEFYGSS